MKTRRGNKRKRFLALLLVALMAISPIASDLPQFAITVDAEETSDDSADTSDSTETTGDTNLIDSLEGYYSFDGTLENTAAEVNGETSTESTYASTYGGAGDTWGLTASEAATDSYNSAKSVSGSAYVFSGNTSEHAETIAGTEWWSDGVETGQDYTLEGNDSISFYVTCTADINDYAAFLCELHDASNNYLTTASNGDHWFGGTAVDTGTSGTGSGSVITSGTTYLVTVTRSDKEYTVTYYDETAGETFTEISATAEVDFDDTVYIHFVAEVGTFDIEELKTTTVSDVTEVYDDVEIESFLGASTGEVTLSGDFEITYNFHNVSNGSSNWENYILRIYIGNGVNVYVRADNYGWIARENDDDTSLTFTEVNTDWSDWAATMQSGSDCTVNVVRSGNEFTVTMTAANVTFSTTATVDDFADADATICLTGENCTLTDVSSVITNTDDDVTIITGFSAHTGEVTLTGDFVLTYTFHDVLDGTTNDDNSSDMQNWYNFILEMVSKGVYVDVRADNYGWISYGDSGDSITCGNGLEDWTSWNSAMQSGSNCTVIVERVGTDITITTTSAGSTFTATASVSEYTDDASITVYLTGQYCTLSNVEYTVTRTITSTRSYLDDSVSGDGLVLDLTTTEEFTISMWVNTKQKINYQPIWFMVNDASYYLTTGTMYNSYASGGIAAYGVDSSNNAVWYWLDKNTNCSSALTDLAIGEWTYITLTVTSNGVITLYYNGSVLSQQTISDYDSSYYSGRAIYLGINWWNSSFCGMMDELTVYSTALTSDEVATLYALDGDPAAAAEAEENGETYNAIDRVSVHDPSIVKGYVKSTVTTVSSSTEVAPKYDKDNDYTKEIYFVFGSHLAWAYSWDLIDWYTFTNNLNKNYEEIFSVGFEWASTGDDAYDPSGNMWAPDVIYNTTLNKWCMYMSINGCSWNSSICMLTADSLFGDWTYVGTIIYSGFDTGYYNGAGLSDYCTVTGYDTVTSDYIRSSVNICSDGTSSCDESYWNEYYGAHAIDPCVIYDEDEQLWMSYGSWSGGIWMIKLDNDTGLRYTSSDTSDSYISGYDDAYMGYHLAGGQGSSGEASYIQYAEDADGTGYYYLYISYGLYTTTGGYNMRLFRSSTINGTYTDVTGTVGTYSSYTDNINGSVGLRVMGYYKYSFQDLAATAQGHNSMLVDDDSKMYLVYHTKSNDKTEGHQLRVRQLFMTEDGWLAAAPFEYTGAADTTFVDGEESEIAGTYEVIFHDSTDYGNLAYNEGVTLVFTEEGTVSGDKTGIWAWSDNGAPYVNVTLGGVLYQGLFIKQSKEENGNYYSSAQVYAFTLVTSSSESGEQELAVWGYRTGGIDGTKIVAADMEALADAIPAQTVNGTSLTLATSGSNGSTITWTSSDEGIIATDGSVTVPETTTTVTLTATVSYGSDSDTKTFEVTVLGADATDDDGNITVWTSPSGTTYDLTYAEQGTYSFPNYFNSEIGTAGLTLYHGVSIEFTVLQTSDTECDYLASNIIGFNAGSQGGLYFTGGSYLGYNGTGGYFDANVYDELYKYSEDVTWHEGTDFIEDGATIKIVILPDTYEVYVNGELVFDMNDVGTEDGVPGTNAIGSDYSIYTSVLSYLNSTATEFDLGWGSWWDGGYTGTISDITLTACASVTDTSGYIYYEDFENLAGATGADTKFISANASNYLSVTTDDYTNWYLKFANSGASGDRGAYMLFGETVQSLTEYTVEVDTSLTAGVYTNRSNSEFAILGTDATSYKANDVVSSGYILKLYNAAPSADDDKTYNDYTNQTTWCINDTDDTVEIPVATWIHIKAVVDVEASTAEVTITNRETGVELYSETVTVNGSGYLGGLYILNGRGVGTTSVDNISVTSYVTVTTGSVSTSGITSIADLQGGGEVVTNSSVTVIAPEVENYTFVGWYSATIDSSGNVTGYDSSEGALATSLTYTFTAGKDIALAAVYRADSMATLTVMIDNLNGATYTVKVDDETVYSSSTESFEGSYEAGTSVTLTADAGDSGAEFAYWMNGYDKIMSTEATYTFVVVSDTTIYPVFNTAGSSNNTAIVDYVTYYGQVLLRYTYTSDGGAKSAPTTLPTRTGYKFSGWSMTQEEIVAAITDDKSTYVKVTPEYTEIEKTYTVKVYENADDTATLYETYSEKAAGDTLTVTAPTASDDTNLTGKTFQYWAADEEGETILSYKESYMVYLSQDIDLYAIYADSSSEGVTAVSTIVMTNKYAVEESSSDSSSTTNKIAFEATRSVLDTETVLETGILFSTDENYGSSDTLKIGAESSSNVTRYVSSSTTNDGVFTLYADVTDSTETTVYARGYVVIKDSSGKLITYYTDVIEETYNSLTSAAASE